MEELPSGEPKRFMTRESPEIKFLGETGGTLIGLFQLTGFKGYQGYVPSAEGIRVPFDREKATARAQRMRLKLLEKRENLQNP